MTCADYGAIRASSSGDRASMRRVKVLEKHAQRIAKRHLRQRADGVFVVTLTEDILLPGPSLVRPLKYGPGPWRLVPAGRTVALRTLSDHRVVDGKQAAMQLITGHLLKYVAPNAVDAPSPRALAPPRLDFKIHGPYQNLRQAQRAAEKLRYPRRMTMR